MMLTLDELNTKMSEMFLSSQLESIGWSGLSDTDKQVALNNAHTEINRLQFIGHKVTEDQEDAFPRIINKETVETPDDVKLVIGQYCFDFVRIMNNTDTYELINNGITSRQVHNIRETYDLNSINKGNTGYLKYLSGWIYRGVR